MYKISINFVKKLSVQEIRKLIAGNEEDTITYSIIKNFFNNKKIFTKTDMDEFFQKHKQDGNLENNINNFNELFVSLLREYISTESDLNKSFTLKEFLKSKENDKYKKCFV